MPGETISNTAMHEQLDWLRTFGVAEEHRINMLDAPAEVKRREMGQLINLLDEAAPHIGMPVTITGDKVFVLPAIDQPDFGEIESGQLDCLIRHDIEADTETGPCFGFGAKEMPIGEDDDLLGIRYVLCHMVKTDEISEFDPEGNQRIIRRMAYFAVAGSTLQIDDERYAHDIREVHKSDEPIYADLDEVIFSESEDVAAKLTAIQKILTDYNFSEFEFAKQTAMVEYLNECGLFEKLHNITVDYVHSVDAPNSLTLFNDLVVTAKFDKFELIQQHEIIEVGNTYIAKELGPGLGLVTQLVFERSIDEVIIPLNQRILVEKTSDDHTIA